MGSVTGWHGIRIVCASGATCLPTDYCFSELLTGTYKVRNETKRNEINENETKRNQQKRNETKWKRNETKPTKAKRNQLKQNEKDWYEENGRIMEGKK